VNRKRGNLSEILTSSWSSPLSGFQVLDGKRAVDYRRSSTSSEMANGTAVNVCTMVFGNLGNDSATGVRLPESGHGENRLFGNT